jgi:hypothetical protein
MIPLPVLEDIIDRAVRTLLLGMLIVLADHRPAHLTRVHHALPACPRPTSKGSASWPDGRPARTC